MINAISNFTSITNSQVLARNPALHRGQNYALVVDVNEVQAAVDRRAPIAQFSTRGFSLFSLQEQPIHPVKEEASYSPLLGQYLVRFVHECARPHLSLDSSDFLQEIRFVITIFIELLNTEDDFDRGDVHRPQTAFLVVLGVLQKLGGALRQYVVDDKGCVMICNFGLPNFNHRDNEARAVLASLAIVTELEESDITCRIGISSGNAYCGYVGSEDRKEYSVMGPSVNLAARLMCKSTEGQILVTESIYETLRGDFSFLKCSYVTAKGYDHPIAVFSPVKSSDDSAVEECPEAERMVGRHGEVAVLRSLVRELIQRTPSLQFSIDEARKALGQQPSPSAIILVAPTGYGKTMLLNNLLREEKSLQGTPTITCQLSDMCSPYEVVYKILRAYLNLNLTDTLCDNGELLTLSSAYDPRPLYDAMKEWTIHSLRNPSYELDDAFLFDTNAVVNFDRQSMSAIEILDMSPL